VIREETCPEYKIRQYISETAQGLAYLQLRELVHGDVKPENILLDKDRKIKLVGYALEIDNPSLGSLYYRSPEVCKGEPCTDKSDIWSLGCVAYELCSSRVLQSITHRNHLMGRMRLKLRVISVMKTIIINL